MKPVQYSEYLVSTVDTDGLVLQHQGISNYSGEYTPMPFPAVYGINNQHWHSKTNDNS